jgi:hypothetical protein
MTIGTHVFLPPAAARRKDIVGHELSHANTNIRGVRETGNDNGTGVIVTDQEQGSERSAEADGAAFAVGATHTPLTAQLRPDSDVEMTDAYPASHHQSL